MDGWFDRIGEVPIVVTDEAKVDAIDDADERFPSDPIIESGQCGCSQPALHWFREAGFIDGAYRER